MSTSDEALFLAYRDGDQAAFNELLGRYAAGLLNFLRRMCGDETEAEDLFQEVFRRVTEKAYTFNAKRRFKPWLFAIAANLAMDSLRREQRHPSQSLDAPQWTDTGEAEETAKDQLRDSAPTPDARADTSDRKRAVHTAVLRLPARQRATLMLVYFHDMTYAQVADSMDCTVGTVKTQMSRALRSLATHLSTINEEPPATMRASG